ncbi:asparagine synthase [Thalassospira xiamenensis]|uniref:asparagine synthase (glutamine-hydrolyzing) n=1 Tax=Thalassospira xiamenensis TaxID=220697 RepID=UPI000DEDBCBC|nr:asparagine synthase (glutamine-hydrolyzing) [Thalassospira xiamenensis]RCK36021.1 asparagine synthase [Thalassospira xiamenensis]
MCGLVGFWKPNGIGTEIPDTIIRQMADSLIHRGPDDAGMWEDRQAGVSLAHRRLSIVDLSQAGHQPMTGPTGRFVITYNGEIYNHAEIRSALEKEGDTMGLTFDWRGHSDTETLLAAFEAWGIKATIKRCVGMFAFAVWDRKTNALTIGRDRLGEKPLYYGWQGYGEQKCFLFGSEIKALKEHPAFEKKIDRNALHLFVRHNYIPAPHSIYQGICKLEPGHLLTVSPDRTDPDLECYWSLTNSAISGSKNLLTGESNEIADELESLLRTAVRRQMISDVPLGAFLSGGIDSSTVVSLMQAQSNKPIKTFTIGFDEEGYDEALHAKAVARHLGTDHTELYVTPKQALDVIPLLPNLYCEPFADSSQIPTFLVSQLATQHVKVALSGDAADELFGGYSRYMRAQKLWRRLSLLPLGARKLAASGILTLSPDILNRLFEPVQALTPRILRQMNIGEKLHKGSKIITSQSIDELYFELISHCTPEDLVLGGREAATNLNGEAPLALTGLDDIQRIMALDTVTYLPDDILVKVDRAAMGSSLESRVPFLDHNIVEFAWRIPQSMKVRNGVGKCILRQVLYRYVPKELIDRPKMGFGVPIDAWLRGPLKDWAENLLSEHRLQNDGYFNTKLVRAKWNEHQSRKRNWQHQLWAILMFQAWLETQH